MSTPQHHIIKETSDSLSRLLQDEFKRAGYKRVHIVDQAPKPDAIEGKLPAVSVYLYQVSLDTEGSTATSHSRARRRRRSPTARSRSSAAGAGSGSASTT